MHTPTSITVPMPRQADEDGSPVESLLRLRRRLALALARTYINPPTGASPRTGDLLDASRR